jgi:putative transposase
MANTYTQLYIHFVFAVKGRKSLIAESIREMVQKHMTGTAQNLDHKMIAIYCMPDHCHVFLGLTPDISISETVRSIKANSSRAIKLESPKMKDFEWQRGYGAFSYAQSQISNVAHYIHNQPEHHKKQTFKDEYLEFLKKFEIEYDEKYLFSRPLKTIFHCKNIV